MWLNEKEGPLFGPFNEYISKNDGATFEFVMQDGAILLVKDYSGEFESDNSLDVDDPNYEEYWEQAFEVTSIKKNCHKGYLKGDKFCINYKNIPASYKVIDS